MARSATQVISAAALSTFKSCPLRYRYRYLDGLFWSSLWGSTTAERRSLERGQQFHLLARRLYAGLESGLPPAPEHPELPLWLHQLQAFMPYTLDRSYYPELALRLNQPRYRLHATFDLLVVDPNGRATIFDWKTESRPPHRQRLMGSFQTLLYRFMLCTAGGAYSPAGCFRPDQVAMVYWNPLHPRKAERFAYSQEEYERDQQEIERRVEAIAAAGSTGFQPTSDLKVCAQCEYQMVCHGRRSNTVEWSEGDLPEQPEPDEFS